MDVRAREQYLADLRLEYRQASRPAKTRLLDEAEKRTGMHRKALIRKLAHSAAPRSRPARKPLYGADVKAPLSALWQLFGCPCGQRMAPLLREQVPRLRTAGRWNCSEEIARKLVRICPKTIDRLLAGERRRLALRRDSRHTRALLVSIPVKLSDGWDRQQLGNLQIDYVLHCGQSSAGCFLRTLSAVDIASGWWEGEALPDTLQGTTQTGLERIRRRLPFPLREIHPDNDSGFLNERVLAWCKERNIQVSRSRALKKNDNCWVEQKNFTHVRKLVGYHRLSGQRQQILLGRLYEAFCDWRNFFLPVMRLESKVREASKVRRRYDQARTPYQRLLDSGQLSSVVRESLRRRYETLNPFTLQQRISQTQQQLFASLTHKASVPGAKRLTPSVTQFVTQRAKAR